MTDETSEDPIKQRTSDWYAQRRGKVTASRVHDITVRTKTGWGYKRGDYKQDLIVELITGASQSSFVSSDMQWGIDNEEAARAAYTDTVFEDVTEASFVVHPTILQSGASPDGYVGENGLLEIKCPRTATHIEFIRAGYIKPEYLTQMQWQMACTGRQWCDFVSYDPRMPAGLQIWKRRVDRDDLFIATTEQMVREFIAEVMAEVEELKSKMKGF